MLSSLAGALMLLGLVGVIVVLMVAILRNIRQGERWREAMLERMESLRMARALRQRGIDPRRHVHEESVLALETQLSRCEGCEKGEDCERVLDEERFAEFGDCPNEADMTRSAARASA
jgi:hypothetical protein